MNQFINLTLRIEVLQKSNAKKKGTKLFLSKGKSL